MQAEELILHNRSHWEVVEHIRKILPDIGVPVLSHAFVVEPVDLSNWSSFMISSQEG